MELKIYDKSNDLRLTASPNSSSTVTEEIGGECSVSASFTHTAYVPLDVDDYIELEDVRYKVKSRYRPKQKNTQTYEYSVKFYAPIHDAEDTLMLFQEGGTTSEFSYDGGPREHLQLWIDNMNRRAGANLWSIGTVITAENKTIDYRNVKCWDAAFGSNGIAATFETEMWADGYVINLCKAERGERVELGYMQGLTNLAQEDNGEVKFFTRLFPLGSTRNIDATKYGYSRLQLPGREIYIDKNVELYGVKEDTEEAAFAEIYPQYVGTVSSVRTEEKTSEEGRKYTVYYFKDNGMNWNPKDYEIPDLDYMLQFQTGELAGRGTDGSFQAAWHEDTREWEIINVYPDDTTQIPGDVIIPNPGDKYIPWNFAMPQEYITAAEQAYKQAVDDYLDTYSFDPNKYTGTTDRNYIEKNNTPLRIGWNVRLLSELYFGTSGGYKDTRITKVQRKLNDLCQATITCSDEVGTGWKSSVDNSLNSLRYEVARQAEQYVYDVIRTYDAKTPSDKNIFSALKSLMTHLRKDAPDQTEFLQKFLGGIITDFIQSQDFISGPMGTGLTLKQNADGTTYAEVDKLLVRMKAIFQTLSIMETELAGASFLFNASGARIKVTKVERIDAVPVYYADGKAKYYSDGSRAYVQPSNYGAVYRCYFLADDGETAIENRFKVGNLARSQSFNIKAGIHENVSNHYYWRLVTAVGDNWIDLSVSHCDEGSDIPKEGDVIVQLGDLTDPDYQSAIVLSAYGDSAPYFTMYQGIDSYTFSGKDMFSVGYDPVARQAFFFNYGRAYIGARDQSSYFEFDPITGKGTFKGELLFSSGEKVDEVISSSKENIAKNIGYASWSNMQTSATQGTTIIKGGKINTDLIVVNDLFAGTINAENATITHATLTDADVSGKITATSGSIGGFTIANGQIGNTYDATLGELSITKNAIRVGRSSCGVLIGYNVIPLESGETAAARIENIQNLNTCIGAQVKASAITNAIGVRISASGSKSYGVDSDAPLKAPTMISTRIAVVQVFSGGTGWTLDFSANSIFLMTSTVDISLSMPTESQVRDMFGLSSLPSNFGMIVTFKGVSGSSRITLKNIYDRNENLRDYTIAPGDSIQILISKVNGFRYNCINYNTD